MDALETIIARTVIASIANCEVASLRADKIRAVYDAQYQDTLGMANAAPALQAVSADVECIAAGDALQVLKDGADMPLGFTVREVQPDGRGITVLVLEAA